MFLNIHRERLSLQKNENMSTLLVITLSIHLFCSLEIIGSWILTEKYQGLRWCLEFTILPVLIPILSPIVAFDILSDAWPLYRDGKKNNECRYQESLFLFVAHGFRSIDDWAEHHHTLLQKKKNN